MNKKIGIVFLLVGVLLLVGVGCAKQAPAVPSTNVNNGADTVVTDKNGKTDIYASAKDISSTNSVASEVKSILKDACGAVKLTDILIDPISKSDIFVYVWKDKPTTEKLESAFTKAGYISEFPGDILMVTKGSTNLAISWQEESESQEIGVMIYSVSNE